MSQLLDDGPCRRGLVERVEVNAGHSVLEKLSTLRCGVGDADTTHGGLVVPDFFQFRSQLRGNGGATHGGKTFNLGQVGDRHDSGDDRNIDARVPGPIDEREIACVVEEELGDQEFQSRANLLAQVLKVLVPIGAFDMALRVTGSSQTEVEAAIADETHQLRSIAESAFGSLKVGLVPRRIAAQCQDVLDAVAVQPFEDRPDLLSICPHTGEVCHAFDADLVLDAADQFDCLVLRTTARTVGDRHEGRIQFSQMVDRTKEGFLPLRSFGRKEFERKERTIGPQAITDAHKVSAETTGKQGVRATVSRVDTNCCPATPCFKKMKTFGNWP